MNISILLPTLWRTERATNCVKKILVQMKPDDELLIISEPPEISYFKYAIADPRVILVETTVEGYWNCMNFALPRAKNRNILWTADDIIPHKGCFDIARDTYEKIFPAGLGVVAMNDFGVGDATCGHAISTRKFLHVLFGNGGFFPSGFHHLYLDTLIADRAKSIGRFVFCRDAVTEHMHHMFGKSERDKLNIRNEGWSQEDKSLKDKMDIEWKNKDKYLAQERLTQ